LEKRYIRKSKGRFKVGLAKMSRTEIIVVELGKAIWTKNNLTKNQILLRFKYRKV
jgi:hypothetical protein